MHTPEAATVKSDFCNWGRSCRGDLESRAMRMGNLRLSPRVRAQHVRPQLPRSRGGEVSLGQGVGGEHRTHPEGLGRLGALGCGLKISTGDA